MIGATLARYFSMRFFNTIMLVFLTICGMVYVVDFVEMLRRASNRPGITVGFIALLSLLRTPSVAEQVLPFCVLFGTMTAFIELTRRLELIVARAAGVSVWQFLLPPVAIALIIGVASVGLLNPLSAEMKQRADVIETHIFGRNGQSDGDTSLWIRQTSVDGQAFLHADRARDGGTILSGVNAYVYDSKGRFEVKVQADSGRLMPGVWQLKDALISAPGEKATRVGTYLIAANVTPDHLAETFLAPESVPFWALPRLRRETDRAGLEFDQFQPAISNTSGETSAARRDGSDRSGFFVKIFPIWWDRQDGWRWSRRGFRALPPDQDGRRSRLIGPFECFRRSLVAGDCRQHARSAGSPAPGGRLMGRRSCPTDRFAFARAAGHAPGLTRVEPGTPPARLFRRRDLLRRAVARLDSSWLGGIGAKHRGKDKPDTARRPETENVHPGG